MKYRVQVWFRNFRRNELAHLPWWELAAQYGVWFDRTESGAPLINYGRHRSGWYR